MNLTNFGRSNIHYCSLKTHKLHFVSQWTDQNVHPDSRKLFKSNQSQFLSTIYLCNKHQIVYEWRVAIKGGEHSESAQNMAKKCKWKILADPCVSSNFFLYLKDPTRPVGPFTCINLRTGCYTKDEGDGKTVAVQANISSEVR